MKQMQQAKSIYYQHLYNTSANPNLGMADSLPRSAPDFLRLKPIAFYLPQFHRISENDTWWGDGFTEWTNVTKALPRYAGHLQPRLPGELGFYDLSNVEVIRRQAELARLGGIYGFCIHDYWFDGKKVLETPLNLILSNRDLRLRFCLNWANESWSRRWDGSEDEILLEQRYDPVNREGYVRSILPALRDPRYIRVDGRPLILIYRPSLIPDPANTFAAWRDLLIKEGEGNPYLVMVQSFNDFDPRKYGIDGAAGFPPHNAGIWTYNERNRLRWLDPEFRGHVRSYRDLTERMLRNRPEGYPLFPGICPSWDNEARKPRRGLSFYNADPAAFSDWLLRAARQADTAPGDNKLIFINAWNEWAEGAVLEPDRHYGYANLLAVRHAVDQQALEKPELRGSLRRHADVLTRPSTLNLVRNLPALIRRKILGAESL